MKSRNTRQKELILRVIMNNQTHPTMQEIYSYAKKLDKGIGQATVYRNVNKLVEENIIKRLLIGNDECYHYDINTDKHDHLICKKCGKIIDLYNNDYSAIIKNIEKEKSVRIERISVLYEGTCSECNGEIHRMS